jgi:hypothetical protein
MVYEAHPPPEEATAQTLNYALGNLGGRMKSWMVPSNAPAPAPASPPIDPAELTTNPLPFAVRGRGRPRKHPVPPPRRSPQPQTTAEPNLPPRHVEPQRERLPTSNSTSPQLANVVTRHSNAGHGPSAVTVFPSPTPSEENMGNAVAASSAGEDITTLINLYTANPAHANYSPDTLLETVYMDSAHRETALSKRPIEEQGQAVHVEKRSRVDHLGQERPASRASTAGAPSPTVAGFHHAEFPRRASGQQSQTGSPMLVQVPSRSPSFSLVANGQMPSPQMTQGMQFRDPRSNRTPPQPQGTIAPQRKFAPSACHSHSTPIQTGHTPVNQRVPSVQRPPTPAKTWYTMPDCLMALDIFQAENPLSLNHPRDGRRLAVLRDATENMDWPYLIMHQYYCMLSSCPEALPEYLRNLPNLSHALTVMHDVLVANLTLSPAVVQFFCDYPYPMRTIEAMWPTTFRQQSHFLLMFVAHSPNYDRLKQTCERRRCPPLARELALDLRIPSTTFQRLLFTAFLRYIWRAAPQNSQLARFEADAVAIFKSNQQDYYQRQTDGVQPQYAAQDREREFQLWGSKLKGLVEGFEATLRAQNTSLAHQHTIVSQQPTALAHAHLYSQQPQADPSLVAYPTEMPPRQNRAANSHSAQAAIQQSRGRGHPPTRPIQPAQTVPPRQVPPARQQQQSSAPKSILPPFGWTQPQQRVPNPARFSLHQAHLLSPVLRAHTVASPLYTFHEGYIKPPTRLTGLGRVIEKWTFTLTHDEMQTIPQTVSTTTGAPGLRDINEQSKIVRLRSVKWLGADKLDEHAWATADTSWIPHSYFTLNGTALQQRKKVHYGKDLPIDITGLLREGDNLLEIAVIAPAGNTSHYNYFIAIEAVRISCHESIKKHCLEQSRVSAEQVLQSIKSKLSGTSDDDDDDISIVESSLTIGLFDPFSQAKFCDIPVRSRACPHNDCFDLETFLISRARKGNASVPDQWKCPICNADARPHMLLVDGFLEDVKKQLEAQGLSQTRQIIVQQDGSWKPKAEVHEGVPDDPPTPVLGRASAGRASVSVGRASLPVDAEVIDLSD